MLNHVTIANGGVLPHIHESLIMTKKSKKDNEDVHSE